MDKRLDRIYRKSCILATQQKLITNGSALSAESSSVEIFNAFPVDLKRIPKSEANLT